jgi:hypothetical protein
VAGRIDYLMFTISISRPGWLILFDSLPLYFQEQTPSDAALWVILINHPGRKIGLCNTLFISVAATPPSKGGETIFVRSPTK